MLGLKLGLCYLYVRCLLGITDIKHAQNPFKQGVSAKKMLDLAKTAFILKYLLLF